MTRPTRFLLRMALFLLVVVAIAVMLRETLWAAASTNLVLNGMIVGVLALGSLYNLVQVGRLAPEVQWLETFRRNRPALSAMATPRLLGPMASMLGDKRDRFTLSAASMRSLLDGISSRLDESREISRYLTSLLIFLGLLGTFWGLLLTIGAVSDVIGGMSVGSGDLNQMFAQLKSGLEAPLRGMGTAFSSSMLGLAGALVLGFLDLQAGQAQNRFFNELEEWLAGQTRLSSGALGGDGEGGSVPVYVQALLEQTAENLEGLQRILQRGEEGRAQANQAVLQLTERLSVFTDQMRASQQLLLRLAEGQSDMRPVLVRLAEAQADTSHEEALRGHIRSIEIYLARMLEEMASGRQATSQEIRSEIKILARTIAAIAEEPPR